MQTRRMRKGGMNVEQKIISNYSPISSKGGRRIRIKSRKYRHISRRRHKKR